MSRLADRGSVMGFRGVVLFSILIATAHSACLLPWQEVQVAPDIRGRISDVSRLGAAPVVRLTIRHRENYSLFEVRETPLSPGGKFEFGALSLELAGREYSKVYVAYLHLLEGARKEAPGEGQTREKNRVIWRAAYSRLKIGPPIQLDCDLDRPIARGQPCRVEEATRQDWLVANGERTFRSLCSECHGKNAEGDVAGTGAPDLRRIAKRRNGHFDHDGIAEWIEGRSIPEAHGRRSMPIWGERLSQEFERFAEGDELIGARLDPVVAYLERIQVTD